MRYRVHRLEVSKNDSQSQLAKFINSLDGEVVGIVPDVTPYFLCYGAKVDYLLIIEKIR